jgi:hypothetical protein
MSLSSSYGSGDLATISYCSVVTGWPGDAIHGITPQLDEACDSDGDGINNTQDAFPFDATIWLEGTEFTYNVIDDGVEVTGCVDECPSDLVIPSEIIEKPVLSIGGGAFSSWGLNSVELPDTLLSIGGSAFLYNNLTLVEIPSGVNFIGGHAFDNNKLIALEIPASISIIHESAFRRNQIEALTIPSSVRGIRANAFKDNKISNLIIPNSVNSIASGSFDSNSLVKIKFLTAPTVIYESPFSNNPLATITYCHNADGQWDDVIIEGIIPQPDESCSATNTENEPISYSVLDLDQNGSFDALTDGLILLRYAFGLTGSSLVDGAIASDANRTSSEAIEAHIQSLLP